MPEWVMPSRASKKQTKATGRDFTAVARRVVEQAIGEHLDGSPLPPDPPDIRNPAAVALSKLGASKGGKVRAKNLSATKRKEIAKKAAKARWGG
jgi:CHASE2 domain-containing sensor protein